MSAAHELAVPQLHTRLSDVRRELIEVHAIAVELAEALDREVDAQHGGRKRSPRQTADALLRARRAGLL